MNKEQVILDQVKRDPTAHTIWVDMTAKIASFRAVENYVMKSFANHDEFMDYVNSLQADWFRFQ